MSPLSQRGFFAQYRIELPGIISPKLWKHFKTKFLLHQAYSWKVTKTTQNWRQSGPMTIVTFRLKDPELVLARVDWQFIEATLCLLLKNQSSPG